MLGLYVWLQRYWKNAALRKNLATVTNDLTTISSPVWYAYLLKRRVLLAGGRRNRRLQCGCAHKVSAPAPEYIFYIDRNGAECRKDIWCENVKSRGNSAFCLSFQTDRIKNRVRFDMSFSRFMIEAGLWVDYLFSRSRPQYLQYHSVTVENQHPVPTGITTFVRCSASHSVRIRTQRKPAASKADPINDRSLRLGTQYMGLIAASMRPMRSMRFFILI